MKREPTLPDLFRFALYREWQKAIDKLIFPPKGTKRERERAVKEMATTCLIVEMSR